MTIKEIAEFTGKNETTVQRWIKKAACKMQSVDIKMQTAGHGRVTDYSIDEVEVILNGSRLGVNAVCILMANAREGKKYIVPTIGATDIDYKALALIIGQSVAAAMAPVMKRINQIEGQNNPILNALPAPQKSDRNTLRQLVNKYTKDKLDGDYREAWNNLYEELYYRESVNIRTRAKNLNITKLDCIASLNLIESSIAIIKELSK